MTWVDGISPPNIHCLHPGMHGKIAESRMRQVELGCKLYFESFFPYL